MVNKAKIPYEIDEKIYKRFEEKNHMIFRRIWDKSLSTYGKMFHSNILNHISSGKAGYSRIDFALVAAGWTVYEKFPFAFAWKREKEIFDDYGLEWRKKPLKIKDRIEFTKQIKKAARFFGATDVGITIINDKWLYKTGFIRPADLSESEAKSGVREGNINNTILNNRIELPNGVNMAIVMIIEMDKNGIATAPAQPAAASSAIAYSKMAFVIACLGEFIRNLGYTAIQCGNDTALSIPLAIDAGLGALGRNGLLITPKYGPRVRICKVFTDLPLIPDEPNYDFINIIQVLKNIMLM
ncbi:MAG: reductive dehalogenase domain-containing protein [Promethearchaeota archaeon]